MPDIWRAANHTLKQLKLPTVSESQVTQWVGNGLEAFVKRSLTRGLNGKLDPALLEQALDMFINYYENNVCVASYLYPTVNATLSMLHTRDIKLALVTNKAPVSTGLLLQQLNIAHYFSSVVYGDSCEHKKPHPAQLELALNELALRPEQVFMVGDSAHDLNAAKAANISAVAVDYGYAQGADLNALQPLAVVSKLNQIINFV